MIVQELVSQGLSEKEAEIYLILIRYGSSRAGNICKRANINRTLVYALLENLVKKRFIERIVLNGKITFTASDPQLFLQKVNIQARQASILVQHLHNIQLQKSQPVIHTFQGLSGVLQMNDLFLEEVREGGEMLQLGQEIRFVLEHPELIEDFIRKRTERKIRLKILCNEFDGFKKYLNPRRDLEEYRTVRFVPKEELNVDCTTYIYGDSIAVISLADEMQGYIVRNHNIADLYRKTFELLWKKL